MRQQDTTKRRRWKSRLKYAAGLTGLAVTVFFAMALPELYSRWQDGRTLQEVTLSRRDEVQFLDTDALDIGARLDMLGNSDGFSFVQGLSYFPEFSGWETGGAPAVERCCEGLERWSECRLLPEGIADTVRAKQEAAVVHYYVQIEGGMIPVVALYFPPQKDGVCLQAVMDEDTGFLYYAGGAGGAMETEFWQCMGVSSLDELEESVASDWSLDQIRDFSRYRFDDAAGAESQEVDAQDFMGLFVTAKLQYDSFSCPAYRVPINYYSDAQWWESIGFAVMFGSSVWESLVMEVASYFYADGLQVYSVSEWYEDWNDFVYSAGRDDLAQEIDANKAMIQF